MSVDKRKIQLQDWLKVNLATTQFSCEPASSDASFRRYFRVLVGNESYVAMDAPPAQENCQPFVEIAQLLIENSVQAPNIHFQDLNQGFLLLDDLGSKDYLDYLTADSVDNMYGDAMNVLHKMHSASNYLLPAYDTELLNREMSLFTEWFLVKLLNINLSSEDKNILTSSQKLLAKSALEQPQVFVHRDFHSRNLMLTAENNPAVIDFQDAVIGPITYDLVSLLRDCYIAWPDKKVYAWLDQFIETRHKAGIEDGFSQQQFRKWFDYMGVQRHMKAVGIFSRLYLRDNKAGYLKDIPRTMAYIQSIANKYNELQLLASLIEKYKINESFDAVLIKISDEQTAI